MTTTLEKTLLAAIVSQLNSEEEFITNIKVFVDKVCDAYSWNNLRGDALSIMDVAHKELMGLPMDQRQFASTLMENIFEIIEQSRFDKDMSLATIRKIGFAV